ncbi:MAG: ribonuclease III [Akkermansiaceae bacterium]
MESLEKIIGYKFINPSLLKEALIHPSMAQQSKKAHLDNQRLEFLGDAVLQLILTERLYEMFADSPEGQLTKLRARLVSREALLEFSLSIGLGQYIVMSKGEAASGGRLRASVLADAFEALIGAIYLDGGFVPARDMVLKIGAKWIDLVEASPEEKNPKGQLQELLQEIGQESPVYQVVSETGPDHQKMFAVEVVWKGKRLGVGKGNSKKSSEADAARNALEEKMWVS